MSPQMSLPVVCCYCGHCVSHSPFCVFPIYICICEPYSNTSYASIPPKLPQPPAYELLWLLLTEQLYHINHTRVKTFYPKRNIFFVPLSFTFHITANNVRAREKPRTRRVNPPSSHHALDPSAAGTDLNSIYTSSGPMYTLIGVCLHSRRRVTHTELHRIM